MSAPNVKAGQRKVARDALLAGCLLALALPAHALEISLPPETATYKASELLGYQLVQQNCLTCHSAQYVFYQPPSSPRAYWDATVKKMKKPFGAPFPDQDIPVMVDYLVKTYGAERRAAGAGSPSTQAAPTAAALPSNPSRADAVVALDPQSLLTANGCLACHAVDKMIVGPAFKEVAAKYAGKPSAATQIAQSIRAGGVGKWGQVPMPPFPQLSEAELNTLAAWVVAR